MFAQSSSPIYWPEQASTVAPDVDALFFFIAAVTVFITVLVAALLIYFAVRYRRRSDDDYPAAIHGATSLEIFWTVVPIIICVVMFVWGARVYFTLVRAPDDTLDIYVVGRQWMWKLQHPDGQKEINRLHVPIGQPVRLTITSEDVIHSFSIPAFRVKIDAVPGRYNSLWFEATKPGTYHLFCTQYCGTEHSRMVGSVVAMEPADYEVWLRQQAEGGAALSGRKLFTKLQCITCHTSDGTNSAPSLEKLYKSKVQLEDGTSVLADETYLRESIRRPNAKIVRGFKTPSIMPPYPEPKDIKDIKADELSEDDLAAVIAYIKSLGKGQTPDRVEDTPRPVPGDGKDANK